MHVKHLARQHLTCVVLSYNTIEAVRLNTMDTIGIRDALGLYVFHISPERVSRVALMGLL